MYDVQKQYVLLLVPLSPICYPLLLFLSKIIKPVVGGVLLDAFLRSNSVLLYTLYYYQ